MLQSDLHFLFASKESLCHGGTRFSNNFLLRDALQNNKGEWGGAEIRCDNRNTTFPPKIKNKKRFKAQMRSQKNSTNSSNTVISMKSSIGDQTVIKLKRVLCFFFFKDEGIKAEGFDLGAAARNKRRRRKQTATPLCTNQDSVFVLNSSRHEAVQNLLPGSRANLTE